MPAAVLGNLVCLEGYRLLKNLTMAANLHLVLPAFLNFAVADGPIDEPADMACLKFPGRAIHPHFLRALPHYPTRLELPISAFQQGKKKQLLPLDMNGDTPPSLLETLHSLSGNA